MNTIAESLSPAAAAAYRYLASRKALHKLSTPCPVLGREVCLYKIK